MRRRAFLTVAAVVAGWSGETDTEEGPASTPTATATSTPTATPTPSPTATPSRPAADRRLASAHAPLEPAAVEYRRELNRVEFTATAPRFDAAPS